MHDGLRLHADEQWRRTPHADMNEAVWRRSASTSYYALFHKIVHESVAAAEEQDPSIDNSSDFKLHRQFDHPVLKTVFVMIANFDVSSRSHRLFAGSIPPELQSLAESFVMVHGNRIDSDYDLSFEITNDKAEKSAESVEKSFKALDDWALRDRAEMGKFLRMLADDAISKRDRLVAKRNGNRRNPPPA